MYQLESPAYFYLLFAIPALLLLYFSLQLWKRVLQRKFADKRLLDKLSPDRSSFKSWLKFAVVCLALACMSFALVNPKIGTKLETVKREGVDVVFAIDVSKSMLAEDIAPNRLEKSKQLVAQIINSLAGDRVGIIGYAGSAFPQVPITTDFSSAKLFLNGMSTDMVSSQGTAITQAIEMAKTYYNDEEQTNRVLFIISDGEDHEGNVGSVAQEAAEEGIRVFTIGVGTSAGGPIPIKRNGILQYYKRDQDNNQVITRLDETVLKEIASVGEGSYIDGTSTADVVEEVTAILNGMDKKEFEAKQFTDFKDQFQWFVAAALLLLVMDILMLERKTGWLRRLNLFNERN
jgi:Ca-activated chloride channel family protein